MDSFENDLPLEQEEIMEYEPTEPVFEPEEPYLIGQEEIYVFEDEYNSFQIGPYDTNGGALVVPVNTIGVTLDKDDSRYIRLSKGLKVGQYSIQLGHSDSVDGKHVYLVLNIYVEAFPYLKYYVQIDNRNRVINFGSTGPHNQPGYFDKPEWKLLTDKGKNYQFTFEGEENPYDLFTNDNGTSLFKWENNALTPRTSVEIAEDEKPYRPAITDKQRLEALEIAMLEVILNGNVLGSSN